MWSYLLSAFYIVSSLCIAIHSLPARPLLLLWFALVAFLGLLNVGFYRFLVQERRMLFMLAGVPLHFLHHFYNGFSFMIGLGRHCLGRLRGTAPSANPQKAEPLASRETQFAVATSRGEDDGN